MKQGEEHQVFDCPHEECGAKGTIEIVGSVSMSPERPIGACTQCSGLTLHYEEGPEAMLGDLAGFRKRMVDQRRHGVIKINNRGRRKPFCLGKFAGEF